MELWSINLRELLAVMFVTMTFAPHLSGHTVCFRVDNTTAHFFHVQLWF
jgi:hypothetical protein